MPVAFLHLLILLIAANSAPILLTRVMGNTLAQPIDFGVCLKDGRRLLGASKTWRGLIGAIVVCTAVAPMLGHSAMLGAWAGALAMLGDLLSSFTKRRMGFISSARAPLLDQIPESALPAWVLKPAFNLSWLDVALITLLFLILEVIFSKLCYRLGIRKEPY